MNSSLNLKWLILVAVSVGVVLALFNQASLWRLAIGPLYFDRPLFEGEHLHPFLDMKGRLAAMQAYAIGLDIYNEPNPIDPLRRISTKPSYPLHLGKLGLTLDHVFVLGTATVVAFLGLTLALLKPERKREVLYGIVLMCSPPVLLGVERANDDLVLYSLLFAIPFILRWERVWVGFVCAVLIMLLTPVKYYPFALLVLFFYGRLPLRAVLAFCAMGVFWLAVYLWISWEEIAFLKDRMPDPVSIFAVGSKIVFQLLGLDGALALVLRVALILAVIGGSIWMLFRPTPERVLVASTKERYFLFGSSIFSFCFILAGNWGYRMIYLLPCIPFLWEVNRRESSDAFRTGACQGILILIPLIFFLERVTLGVAPGQLTGGVPGEYLVAMAVLKQTAAWVVFAFLAWLSADVLTPSFWRLFDEAKAWVAFTRRNDPEQPESSLGLK
ncbi:MAG: DUF2029 domain-containing protein [Opitutales bacterium]|nr:DUF2029 domain-containing protein [Opitutales bacterium]